MCGKPVSRKSNVDVPSVSDTLTYEILNVGLRRNTEKGKVGISNCSACNEEDEMR